VRVNDLPLNGMLKTSEKMDEIQRRLRSNEAQKSRRLLALAMGQLEAFQFVKRRIEKEVNELYDDGNNKLK
jgi:hypothetical protein